MRHGGSIDRFMVSAVNGITVMRSWFRVTNKQGGYAERQGGGSVEICLSQSHMCGLQGFNPMLGDDCPACDERHNLMQRLHDTERPAPPVKATP